MTTTTSLPPPTSSSSSFSRTPVLVLVYISFLLDNILLTVVVPIVPVYLISVEEGGKQGLKTQVTKTNSSILHENEMLLEENGRVGLLLSSKAVVQLLVNPLVGYAARYTGYTMPLFFGSVNLLSSTLLFAFGESYLALFFARSLQGLASACIGVSGMCLVAEQCQTESSRSKVMGIILGSVALGVLVGYPFGSFLFDFIGKTAPFIAIALLSIANVGCQLSYLDLKPPGETCSGKTSWAELLSDELILLTCGAIWVSTSAMAVLEPCLPLWLLTTIKPEKWELGTVFIPDSVGYLLGTNFCGPLAYKVGRWRMAIGAMLLVAVSALVIPSVNTVRGLAVPHFGLGLGIGAVDAALVPLLASLVDSRHSANYAAVYALQQTAVSLAYSLGPMVGGELAHFIGFPGLMRCVGVVNLLFCPLLVFLSNTVRRESLCLLVVCRKLARWGAVPMAAKVLPSRVGGTQYHQPFLVSSKESNHVTATQVMNYSTTQKYNKFNNAEDSD